MLQDLCGKSVSKAEREHVHFNASRWFFNPPGTTDFELWCEMAGYHADSIRQKAKVVMENGYPEQKPVSTGTSKNGQYYLEWSRRKRAAQRGLQ